MKLQSLESLTRYNLRAIQAAATSIDCTSQVTSLHGHSVRPSIEARSIAQSTSMPA